MSFGFGLDFDGAGDGGDELSPVLLYWIVKFFGNGWTFDERLKKLNGNACCKWWRGWYIRGMGEYVWGRLLVDSYNWASAEEGGSHMDDSSLGSSNWNDWIVNGVSICELFDDIENDDADESLDDDDKLGCERDKGDL